MISSSNLVVDDGGQPSVKLTKEITAVSKIPLDEGPGESYHRATHLTLQRASASRQPWMLASTREKQNLSRCVNFMKQHGARGKQVFSFEWKNHKRVLRTSIARCYVPIKKKDKAFYRKLYNIDDNGKHWDEILDTSKKSTQRDSGGDFDKMKREYIKHVLVENSFHSVPVQRTELGDDGAAEIKEEETFFQVQGLLHGSNRSKLVETSFIEEDERIRQDAALALQIQYMDVWRRSGDTATAFFDADPQYINALDLIQFDRLQHRMLHYNMCTSDTSGCLDLSEPTPARPTVPLSDPTCPTLTILDALRIQGWKKGHGACYS